MNEPYLECICPFYMWGGGGGVAVGGARNTQGKCIMGDVEMANEGCLIYSHMKITLKPLES